MIRNLQKSLLLFIALICATSYWVYDVGPKVFAYDIIVSMFCIIGIVKIGFGFKSTISNLRLITLILALSFVFIVKVVSIFGIMAIGYTPASLDQYSKQIFTDLTYLIFYILMIEFLGGTTIKYRALVINIFVFGAILSAIYGLVHIYFITAHRINIDMYLWANLTSYYSDDSAMTLSYDLAGFFRGKGFSGVNASAAYYVTALPLLLTQLASSQGSARLKVSIYLILLIAGELIILSRMGIAAAILSVFILCVLLKKIKFLIYLLLTCGLMIPVFFSSKLNDFLVALGQARLNLGSDRFELYRGALQVISDYPIFGVGLNNYSQYAAKGNNDLLHDENLHSSWMSILFETGILGLISYVFLFLYVLIIAYRSSSKYSAPFVAAMAALLGSAFFNELFSAFYFQFFMVTFFSIIVLDDMDARKAQHKANFPPRLNRVRRLSH